jgi:hypothetical protein
MYGFAKWAMIKYPTNKAKKHPVKSPAKIEIKNHVGVF